MINVVVISGKKENLTIQNSFPIDSNVFVSTVKGLSSARNFGAKQFREGLMVQFDDDLVLSPKIWGWLSQLKPGEYAMAAKEKHVCSRVFAVYLEDFWRVGGFDESIRFMFEDGDFYLRARASGLTLKVVPNRLFKHREHFERHRSWKKLLFISWEFSRMQVKYSREVYHRPYELFLHPFDYRLFPLHLTVKFFAVPYFIIKSIVMRNKI